MINLRLFYVAFTLLSLSLPSVSVSAVSKYEADVTRKWPRIEYGPQTTMYREQCESWVLRLMLERNKQAKTTAQWDASWNTYAGNVLWCQQFPTYREMYPPQYFEEPRVARITTTDR